MKSQPVDLYRCVEQVVCTNAVLRDIGLELRQIDFPLTARLTFCAMGDPTRDASAVVFTTFGQN